MLCILAPTFEPDPVKILDLFLHIVLFFKDILHNINLAI